MRIGTRLVCWMSCCALLASCATSAGTGDTPAAPRLDELVALERAALDRWVKLDPEGYLSLFAADVTYFDPTTERRVNGLEAMRVRLEPMKKITLPFTDPRYDLIEPKVQQHGEVAVLTFNVVNYAKLPNQPETMVARWNSTEVYRRIDGKWRIIHGHWSRVQADAKQQPAG